MKTLVTAIQKGGQGKTFVTCHLAFDFYERGYRVVVIDMDIQGNASYTLANYKFGYSSSLLFNKAPEILQNYLNNYNCSNLMLIEADATLVNIEGNMKINEVVARLQANIKILSEFCDVLLIDTPPSLGVIMTAALIVSDYVISPLEMEAYSLQGMQKMVNVINNLRKKNPKLCFLGMIPNKVDSRKPRHISNLATIRQAYPQFVVPINVGSRDSIAEALGRQIPVWKIKKTAARAAIKEVRALAQYVFEKMEMEIV